MNSINHRCPRRRPSYLKSRTLQIGDVDGAILAFHGLAWALLSFIQTREAGTPPLDCPAPLASTALIEMGCRSDVIERSSNKVLAR